MLGGNLTLYVVLQTGTILMESHSINKHWQRKFGYRMDFFLSTKVRPCSHLDDWNRW